MQIPDCPSLISRRALARMRLESSQRAMHRCQLCAHRCGVNRRAGDRGPCGVGLTSKIYSAQVEVGDECELIPTYAIAFSGCDMRCDFCITGRFSWESRTGWPADPERIAQQATAALHRGSRSIMILGGEPTVHLPSVLALVAELPEEAVLVWKTNGRAGPQAKELLPGLFDVWLIDFKFGNDTCAWRLSRTRDYTETLQANLRWFNEQGELRVRHLLMPGHLECCWVPVARWLAEHLPAVKIGLRSGFWPAWRSSRHPELKRTVDPREWTRALKVARNLNLNCSA